MEEEWGRAGREAGGTWPYGAVAGASDGSRQKGPSSSCLVVGCVLSPCGLPGPLACQGSLRCTDHNVCAANLCRRCVSPSRCCRARPCAWRCGRSPPRRPPTQTPPPTAPAQACCRGGRRRRSKWCFAPGPWSARPWPLPTQPWSCIRRAQGRWGRGWRRGPGCRQDGAGWERPRSRECLAWLAWPRLHRLDWSLSWARGSLAGWCPLMDASCTLGLQQRLDCVSGAAVEQLRSGVGGGAGRAGLAGAVCAQTRAPAVAMAAAERSEARDWRRSGRLSYERMDNVTERMYCSGSRSAEPTSGDVPPLDFLQGQAATGANHTHTHTRQGRRLATSQPMSQP